MTTLDPRLDAAITRLQGTTSGRGVGDYLASGEVDIEVLDDDAYTARFPGSGGVFRAADQTIYLPVSLLDEERLITVLAHEGNHASDVRSSAAGLGPVLRTIGSGIVGIVTGAAHLRNPMTAAVDRAQRFSTEWEIDAYERQALVARELGRRDTMIGQQDSGEPRSRDEMRRLVDETAIYQLSANERLLLSSTIGAFAIFGIGAVRHVALDGVLAGMKAGRVPVTSLTAAGLGASLVVDQWKART